MKTLPEFSAFEKTYGNGGQSQAQVVWTTLISDLETPVSAMLKLARGRSNNFLLESVEGSTVRGRYSFIGLQPDLIWRCFGDKAEINRDATTDANAFSPCPVAEKSGAIESLRALVSESRIDIPAGLPPMASGLVGYLGYDMVRLVERLPDDNPDVIGVPDSIFLRPTVMAVFDSLEDSVSIITPVWPDPAASADEAYNAACDRLAAVVRDYQAAPPEKSASRAIEGAAA
ncbi:MAG: anthranilate synthase component I, partial [Proteobacteria bacterium]|nr:anthranilate synthase component I [Pseudomonadota bacterium]